MTMIARCGVCRPHRRRRSLAVIPQRSTSRVGTMFQAIIPPFPFLGSTTSTRDGEPQALAVEVSVGTNGAGVSGGVGEEPHANGSATEDATAAMPTPPRTANTDIANGALPEDFDACAAMLWEQVWEPPPTDGSADVASMVSLVCVSHTNHILRKDSSSRHPCGLCCACPPP